MQPQRTVRPHSVHYVFTFLLIGLFAVASVLLALSGTRVYREVAGSAAQNSDAQMLLSYIGNKVRAFDALGGLELGNEEGISTLRLLETMDETPYVTSIYAFQDALWERLAPASEPFVPGSATRLATATQLTFSLPQDALLQAELTLPDGSTHSISLALRAAKPKEVP